MWQNKLRRWQSLLCALWLCLAATNALALASFAELKASYAPSDSWLLARDGEVLQQLRFNHSVRRLQWVTIENVSPALLQSLLYSEDKRFYEHAGVDWQALAAASWRNLWQTKTRGASTLTMQLASLLDESAGKGRRNIMQKANQSAQALRLDASWRKDEILEAYLNLVPFRGELQGVTAMSYGLFNKAPSALNAREAAIAAVLIRAPNAKPARVAARACALLKTLNHPNDCHDLDGFAALKLSGPFEISLKNDAPHFARRLIKQPATRMQSSLDASLQRYATQQLRANLLNLENSNVQDGAVVVLDNQTGQVLAWVGSSGSLSQAPEVDSVTALRQAGSTLKPFLYAAAIEKRALTAASILDDSPVRIATPSGYYVPQNYDKHFVGPVSLRNALASSLNVPAVRTLLRLGNDDFYETLQKLGFSSLDTQSTDQGADYYGYSLALGAADVRLIDLTNAYRTLANGGVWQEISVSLDAKKSPTKTVFSPQTSYIIADILADSNARHMTFGLDSLLKTRYWTAVKTGTSKDMRDNWCIGYSSKYTVGVWVGNAGGQPMHDVSGVTGAAPVWAALMDYLHHNQQKSIKSFKPAMPKGVHAMQIRYEPNLEPTRKELFLLGTEQTVITANLQTSRLLHKQQTTSNNNQLIRIAYPGEGTIIALDPDIPAKQQRVVFKASANIPPRWHWLLNGEALNNKDAWFPMPGRHILALQNSQNNTVDTVHFEVRGAYLKSPQ